MNFQITNFEVGGNSEKNKGPESSEGMMMKGAGGTGYRGGSSNYAAVGSDLGVGGQNVEGCRGHRGGKQSHGIGQEVGFAGFTSSQVDELFALFKERQSQKNCG